MTRITTYGWFGERVFSKYWRQYYDNRPRRSLHFPQGPPLMELSQHSIKTVSCETELRRWENQFETGGALGINNRYCYNNKIYLETVDISEKKRDLLGLIYQYLDHSWMLY